MNGIILKNNENIEKALKRFSRKTDSVLTEFKKIRTFEKPCEVKRRKKNAVIRKMEREDFFKKNPQLLRKKKDEDTDRQRY